MVAGRPDTARARCWPASGGWSGLRRRSPRGTRTVCCRRRDGRRWRRRSGAGLVLGDEQRDALRHVTSGRDLALVVGYAGTGKSAMLGVARLAWEAAGLPGAGGGACPASRPRAWKRAAGSAAGRWRAWSTGWKEGRDLLTSRDVLVIDEAGSGGVAADGAGAVGGVRGRGQGGAGGGPRAVAGHRGRGGVPGLGGSARGGGDHGGSAAARGVAVRGDAGAGHGAHRRGAGALRAGRDGAGCGHAGRRPVRRL